MAKIEEVKKMQNESAKEHIKYFKKYPVAGIIIAVFAFLFQAWCIFFGINNLLLIFARSPVFPFWGGLLLVCLAIFRKIAIVFAAIVWVLSFFFV